MSVFVSDFDNWTVTHDEMGHTGIIDPATIVHTKKMDGSDDHNYLTVTCPVCQAVSTHPVGGGAQPPLVQQLFVNRFTANGCPCAGEARAAMTQSDATAHAKELVTAMDGEERWQLG